MNPSFDRILLFIGGRGRSGNFAAYEGPFNGSAHYFLGDVMGKDTEVKVEPCDHVVKLVSGSRASCCRGRWIRSGRNGPWRATG